MSKAASTMAQDFLDAHWPGGDPPADWLETMVDGGWATPRWGLDSCGLGLDDRAAQEAEAVFDRAGIPGTRADSINLWAATINRFASPYLKAEFLRPLLLDQVAMCLLYSEPDAGSDLANIKTTATKDGESWVINGQKVWTSGAADAEYALLIARSDQASSRHSGLTFFFFPMKQSGVEVRPLRQATGDCRFNEVFLDRCRVDDTHRLGDQGKGWSVLVSALSFERAALGGGRAGATPKGATAKAHGDVPVPDISLVELSTDLGLNCDYQVRQRIARLHCDRTVNELTSRRAQSELAQTGISPLVSLGKLAMSHILHSAGRLQAHLLGSEAMLDGEENPRAAHAAYSQLNAYFTSIGGGTDQIQRNIIAERLLGLPKDLPPTRG